MQYHGPCLPCAPGLANLSRDSAGSADYHCLSPLNSALQSAVGGALLAHTPGAPVGL